MNGVVHEVFNDVCDNLDDCLAFDNVYVGKFMFVVTISCLLVFSYYNILAWDRCNQGLNDIDTRLENFSDVLVKFLNIH